MDSACKYKNAKKTISNDKNPTYLVRSQSTYHSPLEVVRVCGTTATTGLLDGHFVGLFDGDRVGMAVVGAIVG